MRVVERTHHIDVTITSGGALLLPLIKSAYPDAQVMERDDYEPYHGSDLEKDLDRNWLDHPGLRVNAYRYGKGLTLAKLAEEAGMSASSISAIEHGRRPIGVSVAKKLAGPLGIDYRELL